MIKFVLLKFLLCWRKIFLRIHKHVLFGSRSDFSINSTFEGYNGLGKKSYFSGSMGLFSYISPDCLIFAKIGRFSVIAPRVRCIIGTHPYKAPFVSVNPVFYSNNNVLNHSFSKKNIFQEIKKVFPDNKFHIVIGSDCWIGYRVSIVQGVTIGDGAVVLAHAVVVNDIPPYAVVGGVPGKIIGYRYDEKTIHQLLSSKWWEREISWFEKHSDIMLDIDAFLKHISSEC